MQEILAYCLNHPNESLSIDPFSLGSEEGQVLTNIQNLVKDKKSIQLSKITTGTYYSPENLQDLADQHTHLTKADFKELTDNTNNNFKLKVLDDLFSSHFRRFSEEQDRNKKLSILTELKERLMKTDTSDKKYDIITNPQLTDNWLVNYDKPIEYKAQTGFPSIDSEIGGLKGTEFVIIIADTGVGKTNLMLNMAHNMLKKGKKVLFFSLEMSTNELLDRFVPIVGDHNARDIRDRAVRKETLHGTVTTLKELPLSIVQSAGITSNDVAQEVINSDADVVMVDYLQRLNDGKGKDTEMERLRSIVRRLKNTALANEVPIITPVQVDKASSKSKAIRVENVAGAKDIANEADLALYLYEEESDAISAISGRNCETFLKIVKSRHSQKGKKITINFDHSNLRMTELKQ
ncbi:MAG: AAA family ATPase [Candidatus Scalindua sp.]|nr:AAA family ATPase [Candidatus Scalindua sp.]